MTGVPLRGMLAHPRWSDVHELTGLATDPWLARAEVVRDLRTVRAATPQTLLVVLYSEDRNDWRLDALPVVGEPQ